jgi:chitin synthase
MFEDQLRIVDADEQKRNRVREAESGLEPRGRGDPYAPYHSPNGEGAGRPWNEGYGDSYNISNAALPLVSNAPFQRPDLYEDELENKSIQSEDYDARSRFTSAHDESNSHLARNRMRPPEICSRTPINEV